MHFYVEPMRRARAMTARARQEYSEGFYLTTAGTGASVACAPLMRCGALCTIV